MSLKVNAEKKEEVLEHCTDFIKRINNQMSQLMINREDALKCYDAEDYISKVDGRSGMYTSDLADTIEWVMPKLIQTFAGGDEVCKLDPQGAEDVRAAEQHNQVINYQLKKKNKWFIILNDWFRDALYQKIGVVKVEWYKDTKHVDKEYKNLSEEELQAILQDPTAQEFARTLSNESIMEEAKAMAVPEGEVPPPAMPPTFDVTIRYTVTDEFPKITPVPVNDFGFPIDCTDIEEAQFCFQRVRLQKWEVVKLYGEKALEQIEDMMYAFDESQDSYLNQKFADLGGKSYLFDEDDEKYIVYECFFPDPDTGVAMRAVVAGEHVLEYDINPYNKPPFRVITPIKLSHRIIGKDYYDLIRQIQKIRTVLLRQMLDNIYFSNNGRYVVDPTKVDLNDFLNGNVPGGIIRGKVDGVQPLEHTPLDSWVFNLMENIYSEKENRTGVTRYSQGTEGTSLNKTFRGLVALQQAADQRVELLSRCFAEMGVAPLVQDFIDMNIRYMKKPIAIRIASDWEEIHPDNIVGKFDIIVNVGIGTGNKEIIVQQMQQLLGLQQQLMQVGVATPTNMYASTKELVRAMGYRNVDDFATDPQMVQQITMLLQVLIQTGIAMQMPQLMQLIQGVAQSVGINPMQLMPQQGTPTGGVTPEQPMQPAQPRQQPPQFDQVGGDTWG